MIRSDIGLKYSKNQISASGTAIFSHDYAKGWRGSDVPEVLSLKEKNDKKRPSTQPLPDIICRPCPKEVENGGKLFR